MKLWHVIMAFAVGITSIISRFLLPPPVGATILLGRKQIIQFALFITAIAVGFTAVPLKRWSTKRYTWRWWKCAAGGLILNLIVFSCYEGFSTKWTSPFNGGRIVIGSPCARTELAKKWFVEHPSGSNEQLIMDCGSKLYLAWKEDSINVHCGLIELLYVATVVMFSITIICLLQALYCNASKT